MRAAILLILCFHCLAIASAAPPSYEFVQLTDIHTWPRYAPGSSPNNGCAPRSRSAASAGQYGDYECYLSKKLRSSALEFVATQLHKSSFLLWTGDAVPFIEADKAWLTQNHVLEGVLNTSAAIKEALPDWEVYPALGNHDTFFLDEFGDPSRKQWLLQPVAKAWLEHGWLTAEAAAQFGDVGYYSQFDKQGIEVLSMNSVVCVVYNVEGLFPSGIRAREAQFDWLERKLKNATSMNHQVMIITHIPIGYDSNYYDIPNNGFVTELIYQNCTASLRTLFDKYSGVISAIISGHTHTDEFRVTSDSVQYVAPALTPNTPAHNPGIRVYSSAVGTHQLLDYQQYYMDLAEANAGHPEWRLLYSAKQEYSLVDMSAQSWNKVASMLDDPAFFAKFYSNFLVNYTDRAKQPCARNGTELARYCAQYLQCGLRTFTKQHHVACTQ